MFNSFLICFLLSVVRTAEFLGRKLHLLLHGTCTVHLPEPRLQPYLCGGSFCILWSSFCKTRRERESCLIPSVCFSFKCDFFPTQSSLFLKGSFSCVVVPLVVSRRWRFFSQLFCFVLLCFLCLVSFWDAQRWMWTWCWSTKLHPVAAWYRSSFANGDLLTPPCFLFSVLFHLVNAPPKKKLPFFQNNS